MQSNTIDSLNIEITSNSGKATGSIHGLVNSLRSLAGQTEKTLTGLRALNEELKKISRIKRNYFGNIMSDATGGGGPSGGGSGAARVKQVTSAIQAQINATTGVDRITKSAAASAKVFDEQLARQEVAARQAANATKEAATTSNTVSASWSMGETRAKSVTTAMQEQINTLTGVDRITKSAAASAKVFDQELGKQELAARKAAAAAKAIADETKKATGAEAATASKDNRLEMPRLSPEEIEKNRLEYQREMAFWKKVNEEVARHPEWLEEYRAKQRAKPYVAKPTGPDPILSGVKPSKWAMEERALRAFGTNPHPADPIYQSAVEKYEKKSGLVWNPAILQGETRQAASAIQSVNNQLDTTSRVGEAASTGISNVTNQITNTANASSTATNQVGAMNQQLGNSATEGANASGALNNAADSTRQLREEADRANRSCGPFVSFLQRVGRIASTMIIRNALKLLMKSFGDAWNSAKAFSQSMGGAFAKTVSDTNAIVKNTAVSIIQTFAPALTTLLPVIYTVGAAIQYICSLIQSLLSLLGISSELFGVNASKISKYGGATSGAGKSAKEAAKETKGLLAAWDELNIIQSTTNKSGGGGGGGSGKGGSNGKLSDLVTKEISAISSILVGEALLAVGLIMACTGHVGPGIGMMVLGAASIAKTLTVDWAKLPKEIKKQITVITGAVGGAEMAVGAVLAFTGASVPLGIGMMALGAASLIGSVALSWNLDAQIADRIAHVTAIAGGALLGLGAVLAFTGANIPIGIGLMLAGAASLAGSVALSWNLDEEIKKKIAKITAYAGISLLAIGSVLAFTGASLPIGIGMMVAGAATLASSVALSWNLDKEVKAKITKITAIAGASLLALGAILVCTGAGIPLGVGMMIAGGVSLAASVALNWDTIVLEVTGAFKRIGAKITEIWESVKQSLQAVWDTVSMWWDENIAKPVESAWQSVTDFFGKLFGGADVEGSIASYASAAWTGVTMWWDASIAKPVETAWQSVSSFFGTLFGDSETPGSISSYARSAYSSVSTWWNDNVGKNFEKEGAWGAVKGFFKGIFVGEDGNGGIRGWSKQAFDAAAEWMKETTGVDIKAVWEPIGNFFRDTWCGSDGNGGIKGYFTSAWDNAKVWWETNVSENIAKEGIWGGVKGFFEGIFGSTETGTGLIGMFSKAWETVSQLWSTNVSGLIEGAWSAVSTWFETNVTTPIKNAFRDAINWIIFRINDVIGALNAVGSFTIPGWGFDIPFGGPHVGWDPSPVTLWNIGTINPIEEFAKGGFDIPRGDLFIANEAGAELVGNMNGKTTVANQGQIVEGIQRGVRDANSDQNRLLAEQNTLLRALLEKTGNLSVSPSLSWSKFNNANSDIYSKTTGR